VAEFFGATLAEVARKPALPESARLEDLELVTGR